MVVIVNESSDNVTLHPHPNNCSIRKSDWLCYYDNLDEEGRRTIVYEICENQFRKFDETGVTPESHDAYFVAQRMIRK